MHNYRKDSFPANAVEKHDQQKDALLCMAYMQVIAQNLGTHIIAEWVQIGIFPHCEASTGAKMLLCNFEFGQNSVSVQECSIIGQMSADTLYLEQFISYLV